APRRRATVFSERRAALVAPARNMRAARVISLTLADPTGAKLPAWAPGAHIDVLLADTVVRQSSPCGSPVGHHCWRIRSLLWPEETRGLPPLDEILASPSDGVLIYCCGPEALLTATERQCAAWPAGALHVERFAAKPQPEVAAGGDSAFEVSCQRSGVTVTVPPGKSIIE